MNGQRIGYIRVSTLDQHPDRQLENIPLDRVFTDRASGKDIDRPQLQELLSFIRDHDTLVVHSMNRLARNLDDLRRIAQDCTQRGVRIEFVKEGLTFTGDDSPVATLMLSVMGAFAEFERWLVRARQREGIALAQQRGAYKGRPKTLSAEQTAELRRGGKSRSGTRVRYQPRDPIPVPPTAVTWPPSVAPVADEPIYLRRENTAPPHRRFYILLPAHPMYTQRGMMWVAQQKRDLFLDPPLKVSGQARVVVIKAVVGLEDHARCWSRWAESCSTVSKGPETRPFRSSRSASRSPSCHSSVHHQRW